VKIGQEWVDAALNDWMYLPWPHFPNLDDAIKCHQNSIPGLLGHHTAPIWPGKVTGFVGGYYYSISVNS